MRRIALLICVLICVFQFGHAQSLFGLGINGGYKTSGPKIELYIPTHLRVESGMEWNRFNIFSTYLGVKYSIIKNEENLNDLWFGTSFNNSYSGNLSIEQDGKFYEYRLKELYYIVPSISYSRKFIGNNPTSMSKFMLLDVNLSYRVLFNDLDLEESPNNLFQSTNVEDGITNYFQSGFGFYVGVTFFLGRKADLSN